MVVYDFYNKLRLLGDLIVVEVETFSPMYNPGTKGYTSGLSLKTYTNCVKVDSFHQEV